MTNHPYFLTTIISDKGSAFVSQVIREIADFPRRILQHDTTMCVQTIGMLDRTLASLKQALKIETGERRTMWHKYANIALLNITLPTT